MARADKLVEYLELLLEPGAIRAIATWPKFSVTSFKMISALARQGVAPKTVVDVGANVGQFAVACAKTFPGVAVHSFEPIPQAVARLRENVKTLLNVKVYPMALGERQGESRFHINSHSHSSSILPLARAHRTAFPEARETATTVVELTTLDRVFDQVDLNPPVLLKLDVQGYEAQTLQGGEQFLKRCDWVILEASFKPMYEGEMLFSGVLAMMEKKQFQFLRPVGWLTEPATGEMLQMDALFQRKPNPRLSSTSSPSPTP